MESAKLKNIAILILLLTNVCLLLFSMQRQYRETALQEQALEESVQFLTDQGIETDLPSVPDAGLLEPQTMDRDLDAERRLAQTLLGEDLKKEDTGAEVYRWSSAKGYVQFRSSGAVLGEFAPGAFPLEGDGAKGCLSLLESLGLEAELAAQSGNTLTFRQLRENVPLYSQQIVMTVTDGSLTGLEARQQLAGTPVPDGSRKTVSSASALISFLNGVRNLGDVCSRITGITAGYEGTVPLSGPMLLTPVWSVETDTGSYRLDLVSGELVRSEPQ